MPESPPVMSATLPLSLPAALYHGARNYTTHQQRSASRMRKRSKHIAICTCVSGFILYS